VSRRQARSPSPATFSRIASMVSDGVRPSSFGVVIPAST
jgi:hypothetical protein